MSLPSVSVRSVPAHDLSLRNPRVLCSGDQQLGLLRYLDGWPKHWAQPQALLIQFTKTEESLAGFATDSFDYAITQAPTAEQSQAFIHELLRVSRQGLILRPGTLPSMGKGFAFRHTG